MESVEDADSVLGAGRQYGAGDCYVDAFVERGIRQAVDGN